MKHEDVRICDIKHSKSSLTLSASDLYLHFDLVTFC